MVAAPSPTKVITPFSSTVSTAVLLLVYVTFPFSAGTFSTVNTGEFSVIFTVCLSKLTCGVTCGFLVIS